LPPGVTQEGLNKFEQAQTAFLEGKYSEALKLTDEALATMPEDAAIHEFRSLVLFALKRYNEAAAAIHAVLAVGPGWDWTTLSSLYPNVETYTTQLRALEAYRDQNPKAADARFLLAYHYLTGGHQDAAANQLRRIAELQPKDAVAAELLRTIAPRAEKPAQAPAKPSATAEKKPAQPPAKPPAATEPKGITAEQVAGTWTAAGPGKAKYVMTLTKDETFTWSYARGARKQDVKGVYALDGNSLAMEPDGGGVMLAELSLKAPNDLHFQIVGAPDKDPGLEFRREAAGK
jgi:predicted Zn-dependent protease